jgi:hypothetical protein
VLSGCSPKPPPGISWKPVFLTEAQGAVVAEVADLMIPRTDTPGAGDVGVPAFIDVMLKDTYPQQDQERFVAGLNALDEDAQTAHGRKFMQLVPEQRMALLQKVHDAAAAEERQLNLPPLQLQRPFVLMMKELTMLGYFTSKVGATQVLQYVAVPGAFHGCIPVTQAGNGKTWAVETSTRF